MRAKATFALERFRVDHPTLGGSPVGEMYGFFIVPTPSGERMAVLSSGIDADWEHVSVSLSGRCPTWEEMQHVKELFWDDSETVLQFHPRKSEYRNTHPFCLHMWRHKQANHLLPPRELIG